MNSHAAPVVAADAAETAVAPPLDRRFSPEGGAAGSTRGRWAEFLLLFGGLPWLIAATGRNFPELGWLAVITLACAVYLWWQPDFDRARLWNARGLLSGKLRLARRHLLIFVPVLLGGTYWFARDQFLVLARYHPAVWATVLLLYPPISVYPQELVYRTFFFYRYQSILPGDWTRTTVNALAFSYMHWVIYRNAPATVLTLIGGFLFARTYQRTGSTLAASIEHSAYGLVLFTVGLGGYFFNGHLPGPPGGP